jgi:hypothetical protein
MASFLVVGERESTPLAGGLLERNDVYIRIPQLMKPTVLPGTRYRAGLGSAVILFVASLSSHAQCTLNEIGGTSDPGNYSTLGSTIAFGKDEIGGGSISAHKIPNIRDGIYGNGNSWIGDSLNSFVGLNFGATPLSLGRIAWGRDNGGVVNYADRTAGLYTLDYTLVPNPDSLLAFTGDPNTGWATIGTVTYHYQLDGQVYSPISLSLRHEWNFPSVVATGVRLTTPGSSFANGTCIDELEAYAFAPSPLTLAESGGSMRAGNIALSSTPFGRDELNYFNGTEFVHHIADINDGVYGNANSWIGNSESSFVGLDLNGTFTIDRFAFGRDNTGALVDRAQGSFLLQYTTIADPDKNTPDNLWTTLGPVFYDVSDVTTADRHEYSFSPVTATGVRLIANGNGIPSGACIDEIEVYQVPEPGSATLLLGACSLFSLRRRKC